MFAIVGVGQRRLKQKKWHCTISTLDFYMSHPNHVSIYDGHICRACRKQYYKYLVEQDLNAYVDCLPWCHDIHSLWTWSMCMTFLLRCICIFLFVWYILRLVFMPQPSLIPAIMIFFCHLKFLPIYASPFCKALQYMMYIRFEIFLLCLWWQ